MEIEKAAPVVLSGAYERRRGYLTAVITVMNQVAVVTTTTVWGFVLTRQHTAVDVARAGALSAVLIGLWRLYAHYLDHAIVRLYPALYLCERALLPPEVCTIDPPKRLKAQCISSADIKKGVGYTRVYDADFGYRGHGFIDIIAAIAIVVFAVTSIYLGVSENLISFSLSRRLHAIGWWLLLGNGLGFALIISAACWWRKRAHNWPVPKQPEPLDTAHAHP